MRSSDLGMHIDKVILPWCQFMQASKDELLDLYKEYKLKNTTVYFWSKDSGYWKLDRDGSIISLGMSVRGN